MERWRKGYNECFERNRKVHERPESKSILAYEGFCGISFTAFSATLVFIRESERFIVILGGPKAYDGVGEVVQEVLDEKEQEMIIDGKRIVFVKANVCSEPQLVIVIAGRDRHLTAGKVIEYLDSMDVDYYRLLQNVLSS